MSKEFDSDQVVDSANLFINTQELKDLVLSKNIKLSNFAGQSFNIVFFGNSQEYGDIVLRLGEKPPNDFETRGITGVESSGYFDINKHSKELNLTDIAIMAGVPAPKIIETGFISGGISWSIQQKSKGFPLENIWVSLDQQKKMGALQEMGEKLATLHSFGMKTSKEKVNTYWHNKLDIISNNLLILDLFDKEQVAHLKDILSYKIDNTLSTGPGLISTVHLEYMHKHVFVDDDLHITGVIDWETGEKEGDSICDLIFSAFWNTDEGVYEPSGLKLNQPEQFDSFLKGYVQIVDVEKKTLLNLLPVYDALWYRNIIWVRNLQGKNEKTQRRIKKVTNIINLLANGNV